MRIEDARELAIGLMREHGLVPGWNLEWFNAKGKHGVCKHHNKKIGLSTPNTMLATRESIRATVLHEIAHALVGPRSVTGETSHGPKWQAKARELGIEARASKTLETEETAANTLTQTPSPRSTTLIPYTRMLVKIKPGTGRTSAEDFADVWRITKVKQVNVDIQSTTRPGVRYIINPRALVEATTEEKAVVPAPAPYRAPTWAADPGVIVTVKTGHGGARFDRDYAAGTQFVVIAVKEKINIAKLGGDGGRYWRFERDSLEKVDV